MKRVSLALALASLWGCGGGGSDSGSNVQTVTTAQSVTTSPVQSARYDGVIPDTAVRYTYNGIETVTWAEFSSTQDYLDTGVFNYTTHTIIDGDYSYIKCVNYNDSPGQFFDSSIDVECTDSDGNTYRTTVSGVSTNGSQSEASNQTSGAGAQGVSAAGDGVSTITGGVSQGASGADGNGVDGSTGASASGNAGEATVGVGADAETDGTESSSPVGNEQSTSGNAASDQSDSQGQDTEATSGATQTDAEQDTDQSDTGNADQTGGDSTSAADNPQPTRYVKTYRSGNLSLTWSGPDAVGHFVCYDAYSTGSFTGFNLGNQIPGCAYFDTYQQADAQRQGIISDWHSGARREIGEADSQRVYPNTYTIVFPPYYGTRSTYPVNGLRFGEAELGLYLKALSDRGPYDLISIGVNHSSLMGLTCYDHTDWAEQQSNPSGPQAYECAGGYLINDAGYNGDKLTVLHATQIADNPTYEGLFE